jgi:hypothetical protein
MATTILHKRKTTAGNPVAGDFATQGQIIINTLEGTISFLKSDGTTVVTFTEANCQMVTV